MKQIYYLFCLSFINSTCSIMTTWFLFVTVKLMMICMCLQALYMYASFNENDIMYAQICLPYKIFQFNLPDFVIFINYIFVCQTGSYVTLPSLNVGRVDHGCARYDNLQGWVAQPLKLPESWQKTAVTPRRHKNSSVSMTPRRKYNLLKLRIHQEITSKYSNLYILNKSFSPWTLGPNKLDSWRRKKTV